MTTATRTVDDEIADARSELAAIDLEAAAVQDALPVLRDDVARLATIGDSEHGSGETLRAYTASMPRPRSGHAWAEVQEELRRLEHRMGELTTARDHAAATVEQLAARRIPDIDDAIALARRNLTDLEERSARNARAITDRRASRQGLDVDARLGDASARRRLANVDAELEDLERTRTVLLADSDRVVGAIGGLLERRAVRERDVQDARRETLAAEWATHQAAAQAGAEAIAAALCELGRIRDEWPDVLHRTMTDWMWDPADLERRLVDWTRHLALRKG